MATTTARRSTKPTVQGKPSQDPYRARYERLSGENSGVTDIEPPQADDFGQQQQPGHDIGAGQISSAAIPPPSAIPQPDWNRM